MQVKPSYIDAYLTMSQLLSTLNRDQDALDCLAEAKTNFEANCAQCEASGDPILIRQANQAMSFVH